MIGQRTHANQRKGIWRTQGESRDGTYVLVVLYSRHIIQFDHTLRFGWLKIILGIISERLATQNKVTSLPVTPVKERKILNMSMRKCKLCVCVCVCVCVCGHTEAWLQLTCPVCLIHCLSSATNLAWWHPGRQVMGTQVIKHMYVFVSLNLMHKF